MKLALLTPAVAAVLPLVSFANAAPILNQRSESALLGHNQGIPPQYADLLKELLDRAGLEPGWWVSRGEINGRPNRPAQPNDPNNGRPVRPGRPSPPSDPNNGRPTRPGRPFQAP